MYLLYFSFTFYLLCNLKLFNSIQLCSIENMSSIKKGLACLPHLMSAFVLSIIMFMVLWSILLELNSYCKRDMFKNPGTIYMRPYLCECKIKELPDRQSDFLNKNSSQVVLEFAGRFWKFLWVDAGLTQPSLT